MATASSLAQSLLAFQAEGVKLQRDSINPHFKNRYIGLDSLIADVLPVLNKCGLVVLQMPTQVDGVPALTTRIVHAASGEAVEATMPLLATKQDPQAQGSALTYARRYSLMAFLGLVADEDTDGAAPATRRSRSAAGTAEPRRAAAEEATSSAAPSANGTYATEPQRKRLFALAKENGVETPRLKEIIEQITGQGSTAQIPKAKYDAVCVAVQTAKLADSLADVPFE